MPLRIHSGNGVDPACNDLDIAEDVPVFNGGAPGRVFAGSTSLEQQHSEDWLIVQYFRTVVTPSRIRT